MGFRTLGLSGLGLRVQGCRVRAVGLGFRVWGLRARLEFVLSKPLLHSLYMITLLEPGRLSPSSHHQARLGAFFCTYSILRKTPRLFYLW